MDEISMTPNEELAEQLRKDFTAKTCTNAVLKAVTDLCAAVGVTVSCEIVSVDKGFEVNRQVLSSALGRLATAQGAMLAGGQINPISTLEAQDPMRILREKRKKS